MRFHRLPVCKMTAFCKKDVLTHFWCCQNWYVIGRLLVGE